MAVALARGQQQRVTHYGVWHLLVSPWRADEMAFAFEELACRGEDVKIVGEYGLGWRAFVQLDDAAPPVPLHEGALKARPEYKWIEAQINQRHPQPRWARMLDEVDQKGLRFMRGGDGDQQQDA